ncbi:MAG: response regulator [Candidatus Latescibacteria bacterium]|nr:response regulator [Candidatus Latescibacterota bacterium]
MNTVENLEITGNAMRDHEKSKEHLITELVALHRRMAEVESEHIQLYKTFQESEISARKLEAQLFQAQKMESAGQFAGGIAHDFNNLLTIILGTADLTLLKIPQDHPLRESLQEIHDAGERAADLVHQLLSFIRQRVVAPQVLNLNDLILDLAEMLRRIIGEDVELVVLPASNLGSVKVDPVQVEQILINVAVNARDAMPTGGKLLIETSNVTLDQAYARQHTGAKPGGYVMLVVQDTGCGMTEEVKAHLFEPFFTTKEVGKGTGLGLATCYGIVKQNGGYIWVDSEVGHGTTVSLYLPCVKEAPRIPVQHVTDGVLPQGTEIVLVAEDEPEVRTMIARMLQAQGYTVLEAATGEEALRITQTYAGEPIHLLVADVVMPQMGGKEVADQLRTMYPDLKVLFVSGYVEDTVVQYGVLDPGEVFLQKPFTPDVLARKVREVLDTP